MVIIRREHQQLRDPTAVRAAIDAKLPPDSGLLPADVPALLSAPQRVAWILGELWVSLLDRRFHIWLQSYAEGSLDGPSWLAVLAKAGRELDPLVSAMLAWTAQRAAAVRAGTRGEAMFSVVPQVWLAVWTGRAPEFLADLVARWPEQVDPMSAIECDPTVRVITAPHPVPPRFPQARVQLADRHRDQLIEEACHALWAAGASDDDLDQFYWAIADSMRSRSLAQLCAQWLTLEGDPVAADARLFPPHPVALALHLEELPTQGILLCPGPLTAELCTALEQCPTKFLPEHGDQTNALHSALRFDPDFLVWPSIDFSKVDVDLMMGAVVTGHWLVLGNCREVPDEFLAAAAAHGVVCTRVSG